jgi:hypothetical protein
MNSYNFIDEIQNDKIMSTLIQVEALQKEYEVTLQQYQEAGKNYISSLQTVSSNPCANYDKDSTQDCYALNTSIFSALKGRTWWGTSGLSEGPVNSKEECEHMCANSNECSGATFNPVKRYCWTRKGDNGLSAGMDSDYALITQQKSSLYVMKNLNERLLDLNNKIKDALHSINPEVREQYEEKNKKQKELNTSYNQLLEQKIQLDKQLQEYYSIEQEENTKSIYVQQQHVSYRFWVLITCLVLLITITRMVGSESPPFSITIWIIIIIVLIILTYGLSSPAGFLMWFILLVAIILMKSGTIPSL